jgi:FtsZ-binding cell division protein ZapB
MSKESPAVKKAKRSVSFNETSEYDPETQKALEALDMCQTEMDELNEKANDEILKVEQKYNKLRKPYLDKRENIVSKIPGFWVNTVSFSEQCIVKYGIFFCVMLASIWASVRLNYGRETS